MKKKSLYTIMATVLFVSTVAFAQQQAPMANSTQKTTVDTTKKAPADTAQKVPASSATPVTK